MAYGFWKRLGLSRRGKKSREKKAQDGPETLGSVASSTASEGTDSGKPFFPCSQDLAAVISSKKAASSTTITPPTLQSTTNTPDLFAPAVPPAPSSTTPPAPPSNASDTVEETHPVVAKGQALAIKEGPTAGVSLWDRAYDVLKEEEPSRVVEYEQLLSRVLIRVPSTQQAATETEDVAEITNHVPNDPIARREKLKEITELGLKHMEDKKISTTLLGHEIVLQDAVAKVARAVEWVEAQVKDAIKDLPYASIVMAGVSLVLPLLKNPAAAEEANRDGFTYVTSQMRYFAAMESLLLPQDTKPDLKDDLTERLVDFYKLIIDFQVQSVVRFYRTQIKNFFRGTINYEGWDTKLQDIKDTDMRLVSRFETAMSAGNLQALKDLAWNAEQSRKVLNDTLVQIRDLVAISRNYLDFAEKLDRRMSDAENRACLQDLHTTNPCRDKERIELAKGGLLQDSYRWVLDNANFRRLQEAQENRLLWIKGDPGKGKTMLLCGIIDELIRSTTQNTNISFFFCQATDNRINDATAVLRGLLYLLAKQQPSLISHVRETYDDSGKKCFEGPNTWVVLSKMFTGILKDRRLQDTYFIIDALDECVTGLSLLLDLIVRESAAHPNVKWVVSSRNWPSIERGLHAAAQKARLSLELNEKSISAAVDTYVRFKVDNLAKRNEYDNNTQDMVRHYLSSNASGTFLWVALVCQELVGLPGWKAQEKLTTFPPGLNALYGQMMEQITKSDDAELCIRILAVISVMRRPITLDEMEALVEMPAGTSGNQDALAEIVGLCGSFLTLREGIISFVHQSAKDFLVQKASKDVFPSGIQDVHHSIFSRSLQIMANTLRRDIYNLSAPGFPVNKVELPNPDPLAAVRYSCIYWIDHLHDCSVSDQKKYLQDNGPVDKFLQRNYLFWLEALSLLRNIPDGVLAMARLEGLLQGCTSQFASLVRDGRRFIQYHNTIIDNNPLQVYTSVLMFSPANSQIRRLFQKEEPKQMIIKPLMENDWGQCLLTLQGHSSQVWSVAWSHDSTRLASCSGDKTVKIWDPATG
ncbi:NACHT domain-containing protein, partial [Lasiosphaeris hirsuta]